MAPASTLAPGAPASASPRLPSGCAITGVMVTCSYAPAGAQQLFVVPPGVTSLQVTATGAAGAQSFFTPTGAAGMGARVTGTVAVSPNASLWVEVGGSPTTSTACSSGGRCIGGWNGGGTGGAPDGDGGGGGGASDVRTISNTTGGTLDSRLLVAGGGGGSGAAFSPCPNVTGTIPVAGGAGGNATGSAGGAAAVCADATATSTGGGPGGSVVGAGSLNDGTAGLTTVTSTEGEATTGNTAGSEGTGGAGSFEGGGGGGGYYGGGAGADFGFDDLAGSQTSASGGGGGSSLVPTGGTVALSAVPTGSVIISYLAAAGNVADLGIKIHGPRNVAAGSRFSEELTVTNYGPRTALGVATMASLPRHLSVITASPLSGRVNDELRWIDPALNPGASATYRITFGVASNVSATVSLRASTGATGTGDPNLNNNNATKRIGLHGRPGTG